MPSHPTNKQPKASGSKKHPGGPLKRKGSSAEEWEKVIGPSINVIPSCQLPLKRTVLQRYRALRIEFTAENTRKIANKISSEVEQIWKRARVPTRLPQNCQQTVLDIINKMLLCHNPGELNQFVLKENIDALLDLAPKLRGSKITEEQNLEYLRNRMKKEFEFKVKSEEDKYCWETDYDFYIDQLNVCIIFIVMDLLVI